jgi:type VI secretion system FHA domain protein
LLQLVSEALQLDPGTLDETRPEETLELVGQLLRLSLEGVHRLLEMRANLKGELGVEDRTTISKAANNPLKQAESLKQATAYLVDLRQHSAKLFMPPAEAVEDAMWDICSHEMALMAGMRAALLASLKMFSPEVVERRIKKSGALSAVVPQLYKSKLWDQFLAMYSDLQREAEDNFDHLLNQEFAKAYGEQSKKLRRKSARVKPEAGGKR